MGINRLSSIYLLLIKSSDIVVIMDIINEVANPNSNKKSIIKQDEKKENVPSRVFWLTVVIDPYLIPTIAASVSEILMTTNEGIIALLLKKIVTIVAPIKTLVAPVNTTFSLFLVINPKKWL